MVQTILLAIWAGISGLDDMGTQLLRRPLLIAPVVGLIMGDLQTALVIGATLEVMWMGVGNVGAYSAPDMITGTIIGTGLGLSSGGDAVATAVALAVPTSLLAQQLLVLYKSFIVYLNPIAQNIAEEAKFSKVLRINYIPMVLAFLIRAVPTFLAVYFGANAIASIVDALPAVIMDGLSVAGKIIPAVGIGLLMLMMIKEMEHWAFLIAGFALAVYLGLDVLAVTLLSLPLAIIYDLIMNRSTPTSTTNKNDSDSQKEVYDL